MKEKLLNIFTPNKHISSTTKSIITMTWISIFFLFWSTTTSKYIPHPLDILKALEDLFVHLDFGGQLVISTWLCFKAMFYSILISAAIAYSSMLAGLQPIMKFVAKARFLTTIGLTFLFAQMMVDADSQKMALLIFSVVVFLTTSFLGVIGNITKDELDYARTLKMNEWKTMYEVVIRGKAADLYDCVIQNFAMTWMVLALVESICRSEGGIGVLLGDQVKHFRLDAVYGIQIVVLLTGIFFDWLLTWVKGIFFPYSTIKLQK